MPRKCQFNNPISAPADWARRQQQKEDEEADDEGTVADSAAPVEGDRAWSCEMLVPEAVFYAEDSPAMAGVSTWMDELVAVSFPHRLSLAYPTIEPGKRGVDGSVGKNSGGSPPLPARRPPTHFLIES